MMTPAAPTPRWWDRLRPYPSFNAGSRVLASFRNVQPGIAASGVQMQEPPDIKEFPVHEIIHP